MILAQLFWVFARMGLLTFGGGYAMVSLIERELADRHWLSAVEFADIVAVSQITPGPLALNVATFVGQRLAGTPGALAASLGLIVPAFFLTWLLLWVLQRAAGTRWVSKSAVRGIRGAVLGLIGTAVLFFAESSILTKDSGSWRFSPAAGAIFLIILAIILWKKVKPIWVILLSAALGVACHLARWL